MIIEVKKTLLKETKKLQVEHIMWVDKSKLCQKNMLHPICKSLSFIDIYLIHK